VGPGFVQRSAAISGMFRQMSQSMSGNAQQSGQPQSGSARDFGSALWHDRFMAALAGASESDPRQLKAMLRIGLGVILVFEVATWSAVVRLEPALLYAERPFFIFDIAWSASVSASPIAIGSDAIGARSRWHSVSS